MTTTDGELAARARLEATLLARRRKAVRAGIPRLARSGPDEDTVFPASRVQRLMWDLHHEHPESNIWTTVGGVRLHGPLDTAVLARAYAALVDRHEALRTVFRPADGGELLQVVRPVGHRVPLLTADVSADSVTEAAAAVITAPFDPGNDDLVRLKVLRLSEREHLVVLVLHHAVSDLATTQIVIEDLGALYLAFSSGLPSPLPELPVQPGDLAVWQNERLRGPGYRRLVDYWTRRLTGAVPVAPPADGPGGPGTEGRTLRLAVPDDVVGALRDLARRHNSTLFMVTLSALHILLARYSGQRDVTVTTPYSFRDRPELGRTVGAFINYLLLRADLSGDPRYLDVLLQVRQHTAADFEHHELPLDDLVSALGRAPAEGRRELTPVLFTEESDPDVGLDIGPGLRAEPVVDLPWHRAERDFTLRVTSGASGTDIIVTYRTAAYTPERAHTVAADYRTLLTRIAADPTFRVFDQSDAT
ncbi:condensation domain-containing protein [Streptomyces sp. AS02]|uniref:condensation domain-containing protein n=1 Tax=Streptomyces sp. AS02 TaxID=2938946 RepID=UPI0020215794|nr:condensation domain-containing protein [Streptomyces sp. AS02]MCL8017545.1 condensation domain-containing protein [Streptomyces sp. AS02]